MTNPLDPPEGNWWDQAVNRREALWLGIAGVWSLGIFGWMSGFTRFGDQNPVGETFEVEPAEFEEMLESYRMDADWTSEAAIEERRAPEENEQVPRTGRLREEGQEDIDGQGTVIVPPGDSVYIMGRQFNWGGLPVVLEAGREYDIHLGARDVQHGFSVRPGDSLSQQINLQIFPDTEWVVPMTFEDADTYHVICNEFCGEGHAGMHGEFYVVEPDEYDTVVGE